MDEETANILLVGITAKEFTVFMLVGAVGVLLRFLLEVRGAIMNDRDTPYHFHWRYFVKGLIRIVTSLIVLAVVIARFQEFSFVLVDIGNGTSPAGITAGGAFITGLGIDEVVKRLNNTVHKSISNGKKR